MQALVVDPGATRLPPSGPETPVMVQVTSGDGRTPPPWTADSSAGWLAIVDSPGRDMTDAFGLVAAPNLGTQSRVAKVTVTSSEGVSTSFEVTQEASCDGAVSADCSGDGISDACEIAWGVAEDRNRNGIPDGCEVGRVATVPGDFPTIQAAIDASVDGWTIRVGPGVHAGPIVIDRRAVTIEGIRGVGEVVLDGRGLAESVVQVIGDASSASADPVVLRHLVIEGGRLGTLVEADGSSFRAGGGILARGGWLVLEESVLRGNSADHGGGLAAIGSEVEIRSSELTGNTAAQRGGGLLVLGSSVRLEDSSLEESESLQGGGAWVSEDGTLRIEDSRICGNLPEAASGPWQDAGGNAWCGCVADLTRDGVVDGADLSVLLASWGTCAGDACGGLDLTGDGAIDGVDLSILLGEWGGCGTP